MTMSLPALEDFRRIVVKVASSLLIDSGAGAVAFGTFRRPGKTPWRGSRTADRLLGLDRTWPQPLEAAARRAETGREPGRRFGGLRTALAALVVTVRARR